MQTLKWFLTQIGWLFVPSALAALIYYPSIWTWGAALVALAVFFGWALRKAAKENPGR